LFQTFLSLIFLTNEQGCETSVAAAVGHLPDDAIYQQPLWMPFRGPSFPAFEILGPFVGPTVTAPRLPDDGGSAAADALWRASEELTHTK
jgi:hypothetical protein